MNSTEIARTIGDAIILGAPPPDIVDMIKDAVEQYAAAECQRRLELVAFDQLSPYERKVFLAK